MLQADSKEMFEAWIAAMQKGIGAAFQRTHSDISDNSKRDLRMSDSSLNSRQSSNGAIPGKSDKIKKVK